MALKPTIQQPDTFLSFKYSGDLNKDLVWYSMAKSILIEEYYFIWMGIWIVYNYSLLFKRWSEITHNLSTIHLPVSIRNQVS